MKSHILIVDDVEMNRDMLSVILRDNYDILQAATGKQALNIITKYAKNLSAIVLDLMMPEMNGIDLIKNLKHDPITAKIPILVVTSADYKARECFDLGVTDFIPKPYDRVVVQARVKNAVATYDNLHFLEARVLDKTKELNLALKKTVKQSEILKKQAIALKAQNEKIIEMMGSLVEFRHKESGYHIRNIKSYTRILGEEYMKISPDCGLTKAALDVIVAASPLHDIGKICIAKEILYKPGKLTEQEFEAIKVHPTDGCELLESVKEIWDSEYAKVSYDICRFHHERWDGKGYPDGLVGEQIPLSAQLVSIADVYDALVSDRCYKKAMNKEKAFKMIIDGQCGTFSPKLIEAFVNSKERFEACLAKNKHSD